MAKVPGTPQKTFASQIETLQSQVFLNQITKMRGLGTLTDAEGQRLATSIANLDPKILQANLGEIVKVMSGAAVKASKLAKLYINPNGAQQSPAQQNSPTATASDIQQAAQKAGISVQEMAQILKSQGVNI
ncbi:hypothetical protein ACG9XW_05930 [Acinetobacter guillouiae]|uniref:hypothetical protein n=1 Tax=Acinetobacter guillouiae TaxID=106649 RepID=UPI003AF80514